MGVAERSSRRNVGTGASTAGELRRKWLTSTCGIVVCAGVCCLLWGSAFPCIKIGNRLFAIATGDISSEILFAGVRFSLSGLLVLMAASLICKRPLLLHKADIAPALVLSLFQTTLQYALFYPGVSMTEGATASIVEGAGTFFTVLMAALVFRQERLTQRKVAGCLAGFAGVALISIAGSASGSASDLSLANSHALGAALVLVSTLAAAASACLIKAFSARHDPVLLSGWQFLLGGTSLAALGGLFGGHIAPQTAGAPFLLLYLSLISAVAYSLWSILLKHNSVSRVVIFGFMNPVFGVILSALLLSEDPGASPLQIITALALVCTGIVIVNRKPAHAGAKAQCNRNACM
jgi:drug/metabolite transporter (DMT)-like permease